MRRIAVPVFVDDLKLAKFRGFLAARGAELLQPTNEYEVLRFRAGDDVHVLYRNKAGRITSIPTPALDAWKAFVSGGQWTTAARSISKRVKPSVVIRTLLERDGCDCFYCGVLVPEGEWSVEHMVPIAHGGTNHISNLALAHGECNRAGGHLSVVEKVRLREEMRRRD